MNQQLIIPRGREVAHLIRGSVGTTVVTGLGMQGLTLISGIITARLLGVDGRGAYAACTLLPAILQTLFTLGLPISVTVLVSSKRMPANVAISTALLTGILTSAIAIIALTALAPHFLHDYPQYRTSAVVLGAGMITFTGVGQIFTSYLQATDQMMRFNLGRAMAPLGTTGYIACAYLAGIGTVQVILAAPMVGALLFAATSSLLSITTISHWSSPTVNSIKNLYSYGVKAHLGNLTAIDSLRIDLALIVLILDPYNAGLYAAAVALASIIRSQASTVGLVAVPTIARSNRDDKIKNAARFTRVFGLLLIIATVSVVVLTRPLLAMVYGDEFTPATSITRILLLAILIASFRQMLGDISRAMELPLIGTWSELGSWIVAAIAIPTSTKAWGLNGAGIGVALSYGAALVFTIVLLQKEGISTSQLLGIKNAGHRE